MQAGREDVLQRGGQGLPGGSQLEPHLAPGDVKQRPRAAAVVLARQLDVPQRPDELRSGAALAGCAEEARRRGGHALVLGRVGD